MSSSPETIGQAQTHDKVAILAHEYGLCLKCSSQLAWGHQIGFSKVEPPCEKCVPVVKGLPRSVGNGWRTVSGTASSSKSWGPE